MNLNNLIMIALQESIENTFSTLFNFHPSKAIPGYDLTDSNDIVCYIAIAGSLEGSGTIRLSEKGACKLASIMLCDEISEVNSDVIDATGEVLNMILGGVKSRLTSTHYDFEMSVPALIRDQGLLVDLDSDVKHISSVYNCSDFDFKIDFAYRLYGNEEDIEVQDSGFNKPQIDAGEYLTDLINKEKGDLPPNK